MSKNPSLCYHNPFKVLFVFKHKLGTQSSQFSSSKEAPAIFLLPRRFSQSNPKDSPPGQILTSGSRNVTRRAALLSTEELLLRILAPAHLSSSLSLISPPTRGSRKQGDYLEWTHCPNTGRGVGPATPIRNTNTRRETSYSLIIIILHTPCDAHFSFAICFIFAS